MSEAFNKLSRTANRLHVALHDIDEARDCAEALKFLRSQTPEARGPHAHALEKATVMGAIVCYARAFVASHSGGQADKFIDPTETGMFEFYPELGALHDQVLTYRHEAVAHSDWTQRRAGFLKAPPQDRVVIAIDCTSLLQDLDKFIEMTRHVQAVLFPIALDIDKKLVALQSLRSLR
jgi:hypothetical protein